MHIPPNARALPIKDAMGELREVTLIDAADAREYGCYSWSIAGSGYARRKVRKDGKQVTLYLHREIAKPAEDEVVDHINGNRLDNRRCNLRVCSKQENRWNSKGMGGKTDYIGVLVTTKGYLRARIRIDRVAVHIGHFDDAESAARAYDMAALHHYGAFARLNFPRSDYLFLTS